jgi:hypothetical protein
VNFPQQQIAAQTAAGRILQGRFPNQRYTCSLFKNPHAMTDSADKDRKLTGWKDIAAYLGVEKTTAQRYERQWGLPIKRPAGASGKVFAYTAELDEWLASNEKIEAPEDAERQQPGTAGIEVTDRLTQAPARRPWLFVVFAATLYASLYTISLLLEVSYRWDEYRSAAIRSAPLVFVWVFGTALAAISKQRKLAQDGKAGLGLAVSIAISVFSALALYGALRLVLPPVPLVEANFQTYTAQAAHLKNTGYFLLLASLFWLLPFSFIAAMERELAQGRLKESLRLLAGRRLAATPPDAVYPRLPFLIGLWIVIMLATVPMSSHILDNLKPGPHLNLYLGLFQARQLVYFTLGTTCLIWYYRTLNGLKHQCLLGLAAERSR